MSIYSLEAYLTSSEIELSSLRALCEALRSYCGYADIYFNKNASPAYIADVSDVTEDILTDFYPTKDGNDPEGITFKGASLILESGTIVREYFTVEEGHEISEYTFSTWKGPITPQYKSSYNMYYVDVENVSANNCYLNTQVIVSNGSEETTIYYSPYSYIAGKLNSESASEDLKNLCRALYKYGEAAKTAFYIPV